MATRFTDDLIHNNEGNDFVVRKQPIVLRLIFLFAIAYLAIYFTASIMDITGNKTLFVLTLSIIIGSLTWFTISFSGRHRDLTLATEFQNAMFASATQLSTKFCLITRRDGSIVYIDPGMQALFPDLLNGSERMIDRLLAKANIPGDITEKILSVLEKNQNDRVLIPFKDKDGADMPMMVTIDLLPRPKGYFLFRGRDYIENRSTVADTVDTASAALLAQALYVLPEGILVTSESGRITFVNHALEVWLGYDADELITESKSLEQIVLYYGQAPGQSVIKDNYSGLVTFKHKNNSAVILRVSQSVLKQNDKLLGISAVISNPDASKKIG